MGNTLYCARGHELRYDQGRGRMLCPTCESAINRTQRPVRTPQKPLATAPKSALAPRLPNLIPEPVTRPADKSTTKPHLYLVSSENQELKQEESGQEPRVSRGPAIQTKMPLQGGRAQNKVVLREEEVQTGTKNALYTRGYRVFENTVRLKSILVNCTGCGKQWWQRPRYETGQTPGIPDLDCVSDHWNHPLLPAALWLGLEQKGTTTALSPEQRELRDAGITVVSRTVEENLAAVEKTDRFFEYIAGLEDLKNRLNDLLNEQLNSRERTEGETNINTTGTSATADATADSEITSLLQRLNAMNPPPAPSPSEPTRKARRRTASTKTKD